MNNRLKITIDLESINPDLLALINQSESVISSYEYTELPPFSAKIEDITKGWVYHGSLGAAKLLAIDYPGLYIIKVKEAGGLVYDNPLISTNIITIGEGSQGYGPKLGIGNTRIYSHKNAIKGGTSNTDSKWWGISSQLEKKFGIKIGSHNSASHFELYTRKHTTCHSDYWSDQIDTEYKKSCSKELEELATAFYIAYHNQIPIGINRDYPKPYVISRARNYLAELRP